MLISEFLGFAGTKGNCPFGGKMTEREPQAQDIEPIQAAAQQGGKSAKSVRLPKTKTKKKNRKRAGSYRPYPRVPLERALLVVNAIKEKNGGNPWSAEQVATAVGLSRKNV